MTAHSGAEVAFAAGHFHDYGRANRFGYSLRFGIEAEKHVKYVLRECAASRIRIETSALDLLLQCLKECLGQRVFGRRRVF